VRRKQDTPDYYTARNQWITTGDPEALWAMTDAVTPAIPAQRTDGAWPDSAVSLGRHVATRQELQDAGVIARFNWWAPVVAYAAGVLAFICYLLAYHHII
jgi:hypothetical protein